MSSTPSLLSPHLHTTNSYERQTSRSLINRLSRFLSTVLRTLTGHKSSVRCLDFHPYGDFVASGSLDNNIKLWDIRKKGCMYTYKVLVLFETSNYKPVHLIYLPHINCNAHSDGENCTGWILERMNFLPTPLSVSGERKKKCKLDGCAYDYKLKLNFIFV